MEIQLIRNAAAVLRPGERRILTDPCLSPKGRLPPYAFFRRPPRLNPTADLPENTEEALAGIDVALITHFRFGHLDHLDPAGLKFLKRNRVPVFCSPGDARALARKGVDSHAVGPAAPAGFLGGTLETVPAAHGRGLVGRLMGRGVGFLLRLPEEPSVYIAGDTVLTAPVRRVLAEEKPDVCIINAGCAILDMGQPILMSMEEILEFVRLAPGKVVAVHMEALNHCTITRKALRERLAALGLSHKVLVPEDGETVDV